MTTTIKIALSVALIFAWWFVGGLRLQSLKESAPTKAQEICGEGSKIVYQGYQRSLFSGFGGRVWYQCQIKDVWYMFFISQRINSHESQVYNFEQKTVFPNNFNINQ